MTIVLCEEVRALKKRLKEINDIPFDEIEWVDKDGQPAKVTDEQKREWQFIGLNNADFVKHVIDGADGITILTFSK